MTKRIWKVDDAVTLSHGQHVGDEMVDWDEMGIIMDIDEDTAWVENVAGKEFEIPLTELVEY